MSYTKPLWKLAVGTHDEPTPNGEACLVETSVVAAGFSYRPISYSGTWPRCYSNVIATVASVTHDGISDDDLRERLMRPFITRLAYTRATGAIERKRAQYITLEYAKRIFSVFSERWGEVYKPAALKCRHAQNVDEAIAEVDWISNTSFCRGDTDLYGLARTTLCILKYHYSSRKYAELSYRAACLMHQMSEGSDEQLCIIACEILDEAIKLGRHREIDADKANVRLASMQETMRQVELAREAKLLPSWIERDLKPEILNRSPDEMERLKTALSQCAVEKAQRQIMDVLHPELEAA
jgi:hypothetical protein